MTEIIAKHHSPRELGDLVRAALGDRPDFYRGLCPDQTCLRCVVYRSVLEEEVYDAQQEAAIKADPAATRRLLDAVRDHHEAGDEEPRTAEPWAGYR